ncbi:MAG: sugar ABC transporter permease [Saccharofermentanales bacterium]|jgi:ABC-type sugar transport system permease subunit
MKPLANRQRRSDLIFVFSILIPIMALFTIIRFIPIGDTIVTSFFKRDMIRPGEKFVGLDNYKYIFTDKSFGKSLLNTGFIAAFSMFFSVFFGLFLAVEVNQRQIKGLKVAQTLFFLPVIVSMVPATLMWKMLFDYNVGVINYILKALGAHAIDWINNEKIVRWPIVIISVWKEMGYNMMLFYVGLKAIPRDLYESADLDGAGRWAQFRYITVPQLKPITLFVLVVSLIKFVKVFTQAIVMTSGSQSSGNIMKTVVYYIYQQGFSLHSMGRASAASVVLLIIVFLLTWLQMHLGKEK